MTNVTERGVSCDDILISFFVFEFFSAPLLDFALIYIGNEGADTFVKLVAEFSVRCRPVHKLLPGLLQLLFDTGTGLWVDAHSGVLDEPVNRILNIASFLVRLFNFNCLRTQGKGGV